MDPDWKERAEGFLRELGVSPKTNEATLRELPVKVHITPNEYQEGLSEGSVYVNSLAFWDTIAPHYKIWVGPHFAELVNGLAYLAAEIERIGPERVLDAGCGIGLDLAFLAVSFPATQFVGYDFSVPMVARTSELIQRIGLKNAHADLLTHVSMPSVIESRSMDMVICRNANGGGEAWLSRVPGFSRVLRTGGMYVETGMYDTLMVDDRLDHAKQMGFDPESLRIFRLDKNLIVEHNDNLLTLDGRTSFAECALWFRKAHAGDKQDS